MGDLVFTTPLAIALKRRWPQAELAWLVSPGLAGLLESVPAVDTVLTFSPPAGLGWFAALRALRRELRARDFDLVIDAQGLLKSRALAGQAGGYRIGFDSSEPGRWWLHQTVDKGGDVRLIGSEYRYLAEQLTAERAPPPHLEPRPAHRQQAAALRAAQGLGEGWIALCPFTTRPQKHWPDGHWPALIERLRRRLERPIAVLGGPGDAEHAARLIAEHRDAVVNLAGRTPVALLPALIESAALLIGVDTGLTHIGVATRRPTIALFGSTCPYRDGGEAPLRVLYDDLPCAPCRRRPTCNGAYTCMSGLEPARVAAAADELLGAS